MNRSTFRSILEYFLYAVILVAIVIGIYSYASIVTMAKPRVAQTEEPLVPITGYAVFAISGNPNIRETAGVSEGNCLGAVKKDCTVQVSCYYEDSDWRNGTFYGFLVEDLEASQGDHKWFPRGIERDDDGIVWINEAYATISPHAAPAAQQRGDFLLKNS